MDYVYGQISQKAIKNTYTGASTKTADVIIDNANSTISVVARLDSDNYRTKQEQDAIDATKADADGVYTKQQVDELIIGLAEEADLLAHEEDVNNPHSVTKEQIGLSNVDNTSDLNKPISNETREALSTKADDNEVVHKTENEEIYGQKTFNDKFFVNEIDGTEPAFLIVNLYNDNVGLNNSGFYFNAFAPLWSAEKALYFPELQEGDFKTIATTDQIPVQTSQLENDSGFITKEVDDLANYRTSANQDIIDSGKATTAQIDNLQSQIDLKER